MYGEERRDKMDQSERSAVFYTHLYLNEYMDGHTESFSFLSFFE